MREGKRSGGIVKVEEEYWMRVLDYDRRESSARRFVGVGVLCVLGGFSAVCAWLKSGQYHSEGQLNSERVPAAFFLVFSIVCMVVAGVRIATGGRAMRTKAGVAAFVVFCVVVLVFDVLAVHNLATALRSGTLF